MVLDLLGPSLEGKVRVGFPPTCPLVEDYSMRP